nr:GIY-YIG nuclease family protein [Homoserinibacter gongjuensis]
MLRCSDGSYYVGSARDLDARMQQHASGRGRLHESAHAGRARLRPGVRLGG